MAPLASVSDASGNDSGNTDESSEQQDDTTQGSRAARRQVSLKGVGSLADGTCFGFSVVDLSYDGCSIEPEVALFPGVKFQMSVLGCRGAVNAVVRWHRDGRAGIEFCADESADRKHTPRAHERHQIAGTVMLRRMGRKEYHARLFNMTPNGCRVEFIERPRPGELLWVTVEGLDSVEAGVRWIDGFYGGVEFTRPHHPAIFDSLVGRMSA